MKQYIDDPYTKYYTDQAGSGISVYRGSHYQKGHGVGSFLSGLFKAALPLFKSGIRTVGKEALLTGANLLQDISENRNVKESTKQRLNEASENLKRKAVDKLNRMAGAGLKRRRLSHNLHSTVSARRNKKPIKKRNITQDIFH